MNTLAATKFPPGLGRVTIAVLAWLFLATAALAHASLTATEPRDGAVVPTSPTTLALSFSEPVSPLALKLVKPDGSAVALERFSLRDRTVEIEVPPGLTAGTHVLSWRVVSEDGHPVSGSILFSIGSPSGSTYAGEAIDWPVRAALWTSRVALYAGLFFGIGGVFALSWLLQGARAGRRFIAAMLGIGLAGTALSAGFQGLDALGRPLSALAEPSAWSTGLGTSFGKTVIVMTVALALAGVALVSRREQLARWISLTALIAGSLALSLSGHASAAEPQWLMRPSVFLHAITIALWVGALVPIARLLQAGHPHALKALHRFSVFIPFSVAVLVAAGIVLLIVQVGQPSALLDTAYGNIFLVKLALLVVLFALAAINRWVLTDRVEAGDRGAARHLVHSIAAETLLVLLVFGVTASWRFTPPPRALVTVAAEPASVHIHGEKAMAEITITPGQPGPVEASALVMDGDFSALDPKEVTFVFSNPSAGVTEIKRKASKAADGTWRTSDLLLPLPGLWKVRLDILISDFEIARIEGEIQIGP
ncbi:copper resistance CopC/CopD family protein [Sinorhizobium mexicanum]|uniref:Copper resistance protein CopC n=1 Tax=Sinorhizobium mexicanum TaxID=375549 RepID=A0A859QY02_9HYPH|nr:copper resistance CopC/CopD family protein [Sinorhizobium mexicanum]MBP1887632.1 copper transport protein [Sinorhizobium mexicanum]QLL62228.1 copper resistance protein CopC [Sinorhizobium mexicanum]